MNGPRLLGPRARQLGLSTVARHADLRPDTFDAPPRGVDDATLGMALRDRGAISADDLEIASTLAARASQPLCDILLSRRMVSEMELLATQSRLFGCGLVNLANADPDETLAPYLNAETAITRGVVLWKRAGSAFVLAGSSPQGLDEARANLPPGIRVLPVLAPRADILAAQVKVYGESLVRHAEGRVPQSISCRGWHAETVERAVILALLGAAIICVAAPTLALWVIFLLALCVFVCNVTLKALAFGSTLRAEHRAKRQTREEGRAAARPQRLRDPVVTILIALYREDRIVGALIDALSKLDYPPEHLDIILCTEAQDDAMHRALAARHLPPFMRSVTAPPGHPQTKPRALNFGLNFARGEIVGIYDAEDRPDPDQIRRVVDRFSELGPDVACLQGRLDYYNAYHNRLSRCFAIEYAGWFRVLLPGVQRLGLFVPLGGTTLFLRRDVLERVGAWDAHNVTEDAELGLRLARSGFRTEMVDTTTFEEANAAVWPWVKQRTRWQKGYLMTWAAAMRRPMSLWRDLGTRQFIGLQVQVLFAVTGFLVAPLIWTLIGVPFGMPHPLDALLSPIQFGALGALMVSSLVLSVAIAWHATRAPHLRLLRKNILMSEVYHVLGTVAAWRAAVEMLLQPFYWAKTEHGGFTVLNHEAAGTAKGFEGHTGPGA